ncbi:hypothetical protein HYG86_18120 [Alkalicella caledoniensis]|uniref:PCI domain-containing protein n=1 Tax=Alkalicella caledoniensis TaxID=2731377 RepID=A0A7G9WCZ0_ALKCA|nr:hypothetical protein [Alkalicella caledoniensis]QNO16552.1 hypothetical protein HYG86_18120 [Alkalicella caledoniensis]
MEVVKNRNFGWMHSWPVIVLAFIFFWPVGILLLITRLTKDRKTSMVAGKGLSILGYILVALYSLFFIMVLVGEFPGEELFVLLAFGVLLLLPGVLLVRFGRKLVKQSAVFKKYLNLIINHRMSSIEEIATSMQKDIGSVRKDIESMIDKNFLPNAFIDQNLYIRVPSVEQQVAVEDQPHSSQPSKVTRNVTCNGCGANNIIIEGETTECEYCGASL